MEIEIAEFDYCKFNEWRKKHNRESFELKDLEVDIKGYLAETIGQSCINLMRPLTFQKHASIYADYYGIKQYIICRYTTVSAKDEDEAWAIFDKIPKEKLDKESDWDIEEAY